MTALKSMPPSSDTIPSIGVVQGVLSRHDHQPGRDRVGGFSVPVSRARSKSQAAQSVSFDTATCGSGLVGSSEAAAFAELAASVTAEPMYREALVSDLQRGSPRASTMSPRNRSSRTCWDASFSRPCRSRESRPARRGGDPMSASWDGFRTRSSKRRAGCSASSTQSRSR